VPNSAPSQSSAIPPSNADSSKTVKSCYQQWQQLNNKGHDMSLDNCHTHNQTTSTPSSDYITDNNISIPDIDQSILESALIQQISRGGGSSFTLVRQISQAYITFEFNLLNLIYSCDLLMIISPVAAWSTWPVPPSLISMAQLIYCNG